MTKLGYYPVFFRPKNLIIRQTIDTPQLRVRTTRTQPLNRRHFEVPRCFVQRTIVGTSILCIDRRAPVKQQVEFVDSASGGGWLEGGVWCFRASSIGRRGHDAACWPMAIFWIITCSLLLEEILLFMVLYPKLQSHGTCRSRRIGPVTFRSTTHTRKHRLIYLSRLRHFYMLKSKVRLRQDIPMLPHQRLYSCTCDLRFANNHIQWAEAIHDDINPPVPYCQHFGLHSPGKMQGDYILNDLLESSCRQAGSDMISENRDFGTEAILEVEKPFGRY